MKALTWEGYAWFFMGEGYANWAIGRDKRSSIGFQTRPFVSVVNSDVKILNAIEKFLLTEGIKTTWVPITKVKWKKAMNRKTNPLFFGWRNLLYRFIIAIYMLLERFNAMASLGALDSILHLLEDGVWHTINEISTLEPLRKMKITTLMDLLNFLAEYEFIEVNQRPGYDLTAIVIEAKLTSPLASFMRKIKWAERAT